MIDLKKYSWILILIGGILVLLAAVLPSIGYIDLEGDNSILFWIFGLIWREGGFNEGLKFVKDEPAFVAVGTIGAVFLIIFALIYIISAILTVATDVKLPIKEYVWFFMGIALFFFPIILKSTMGAVVEEGETLMYLLLPIDLFSFFISLGAIFGTLAGFEEIIGR